MSFLQRYIYIIYLTAHTVVTPQTKLSYSRQCIRKTSCAEGNWSFYKCIVVLRHSKSKSSKQHKQTRHSHHSHVRFAGFRLTLRNPAITKIPAKFGETQIDDTQHHKYKKESFHRRSSFLVGLLTAPPLRSAPGKNVDNQRRTMMNKLYLCVFECRQVIVNG